MLISLSFPSHASVSPENLKSSLFFRQGLPMKHFIFALVLLVFVCDASESNKRKVSSSNGVGGCKWVNWSFDISAGGWMVFCCHNLTEPNVAFRSVFQSQYSDGYYSVTNMISSDINTDHCPPSTRRANTTAYYNDGDTHQYSAFWTNVPWRKYSAHLWFGCENTIDDCIINASWVTTTGYNTTKLK